MQLFVFLTVCSPQRRCYLKCLFRGCVICLGLTGIKPPGLSCSWLLTPGWGWRLPGVPLPADLLVPLGEASLSQAKRQGFPSAVQRGGQATCMQWGVHRGEGFGTKVLQRVGPSPMQSCLPRPMAPQGCTRWYKVSSALQGYRSVEEVPLHRRRML